MWRDCPKIHASEVSTGAIKKYTYRGALFSSGQGSGQITPGKFRCMRRPNSFLCSKGAAWNSEMYVEVMQNCVRQVYIHTHTHIYMYLCGYCFSFMKPVYIGTQFQSHTELYFPPS